MTATTPRAANKQLAERARQLAAGHPPRSRERRTVAALWAALSTTRTPAAARQALGTFTSGRVQADAALLLEYWQATTHTTEER